MSPEEFKKRWLKEDFSLAVFSENAIDLLNVPPTSKTFLKNAGLPEGAAPFLSFGAPYLKSIPTVESLWKKGPEFQRYRMIGTNGSGDPVCLDEEGNGSVFYLNHDNGMCPVFINSSVEQLASSLLAYRKLVEETITIGGNKAWMEKRIPAELGNLFVEEVKEIDRNALNTGTFWSETITPFAR